VTPSFCIGFKTVVVGPVLGAVVVTGFFPCVTTGAGMVSATVVSGTATVVVVAGIVVVGATVVVVDEVVVVVAGTRAEPVFDALRDV
jgi:hypothetical protein